MFAAIGIAWGIWPAAEKVHSHSERCAHWQTRFVTSHGKILPLACPATLSLFLCTLSGTHALVCQSMNCRRFTLPASATNAPVCKSMNCKWFRSSQDATPTTVSLSPPCSLHFHFKLSFSSWNMSHNILPGDDTLTYKVCLQNCQRFPWYEMHNLPKI